MATQDWALPSIAAMNIAAQYNGALSIGVIVGILVTVWIAMGGVKAASAAVMADTVGAKKD